MRKNASRNAVIRRHLRLRKKISGTAACPRLNVFRSLANIYAQIIDDEAGVTLVSANTLDKEIKAEFPYGGNAEAAKAVGALVAKRALEKGALVHKIPRVLASRARRVESNSFCRRQKTRA